LITASKLLVETEDKDGNTTVIDLGRVGKIDEVHPAIIEKLRESGFVPVIAPIGDDASGHSFNINADVAAANIAAALGADKLILLTDVPGILDDRGDLQPFVTIEHARQQVESGHIKGGMVPKVECAMAALEGGVGQVHIIDGRVSHAVLLEIFTKTGVGSEVVKEMAPADDINKGE
jgi:acetylglutamate kinase